MDKLNITHHISAQFNAELEDIRNRVLAMGGLVEQQIRDALSALDQRDHELGESVVINDYKVNAMEVAIDEECARVLARRQPTASDLRLVLAVIKTITELERIGDQAERIGKMACLMSELDDSGKYYHVVNHIGERVQKMVHDALDAFARLDVQAAIVTAACDTDVDHEYESILRQLITHMMEDPRSISRVINVIWSARAIERIGDHAKNICEYIIYLVEGKDVRHTTLESFKELTRED